MDNFNETIILANSLRVSTNLSINEDEIKHLIEKLKNKEEKVREAAKEKLLLESADLPENVKKIFNFNNVVNYMMDKNEFWANIYNDLFNGLQKIYWLKFKDIYEWDSFIDLHFSSLKNYVANVSKIQESEIYKYWKKIVVNNDFYFIVLAVIWILDQDFFNEIVEKLKNK